MQPFTSKHRNAALTASALVLALALGGCNQHSHLGHSDKISPAAGDAVKAAALLQTVDPWPDNVLDTDLTMDGELAVKRATDYKAGNTTPLAGQRTTDD